jgi:hypothetical protein
LGTLPAALEGSLDVFIPMIASLEKADATNDRLGVSSRRVVILEKSGIRWDFQSALAQYYKAAKCGNGIAVEMNQRTSQIICDAG